MYILYFWVIIQYHVIYFHAQIVPTMAIGSFFMLAPIHLHYFYFSLSTSFLLLQDVPSISYFSREPWFLLFENGIWNQDLGVGCAYCYWDVIASKPSQWTELSNYVCMRTHTRTVLNNKGKQLSILDLLTLVRGKSNSFLNSYVSGGYQENVFLSKCGA